MYNPKSSIAEEFINHEEVLASLEYAQNNKNNVELIDKVLEKARLGKGLTHREAAILLDCEIEEKNQETQHGTPHTSSRRGKRICSSGREAR